MATYHVRMILKFVVANKGLTVACIALVFMASFVAQIPNEEIARKIGVEQTFADMLISSVGSNNSFSAAWCLVPLVSQGYLSYLFSQNYSDNFMLRWRRRSSLRVGKVIDGFVVSIAVSLVMLVSVALISCFRGCMVSNFSDAHSLFSYYVQMSSTREPDALFFVMVMSTYALLAVSTVNQLYLLLNKFLRKDAVAILLLFLVGYFQLYASSDSQMIFGNVFFFMRKLWNPLGVIYTAGDVGYASWLIPSFHGLLPMLAVLATLVLLNGLVPEKPGRN